jgi:hypothetical protein
VASGPLRTVDVVPSRKGIAENLIAWALIATGGYVIHHFGHLAAGWTIVLIVAAVLLVTGLLFLRSARPKPTPEPTWSAYYEGGKGGEGGLSGAGGGGGGAAFGGIGGKGGDVILRAPVPPQGSELARAAAGSPPEDSALANAAAAGPGVARSDFISTSINPDFERLEEIQANKTHLQATALVALSLGQTIQFEGDVYSVHQHQELGLSSVGFEFGSYTVFAYFDPEDAGALIALNQGDRVVITGELSRAEPGTYMIDHSRILSVSPRH